jgi:hypothetical protein
MTKEEDAHKHQLKQAEQLLRDAGFTSDEDANYRLEEDPGGRSTPTQRTETSPMEPSRLSQCRSGCGMSL